MRWHYCFGLATCLAFVASPVVGQEAGSKRESLTAESNRELAWLQTGRFSWTSSGPLVQADPALFPASPEHPWLSVKDPSIVRFRDRWHLFCSVRKKKSGDGRIRIGYTSFHDWNQAAQAKWSVLELTPGYHGAPQVFFFEPQQTWYMIYQAEDASRDLAFGPCFSTNANLADPTAWTLPRPLYKVPPGKRAGLDFWVICDERQAHLFFTTLDGRMWRSATALDQFPDEGWSDPAVVLHADIFEASHTYKVKGTDQYLTLVEAQEGRTRRYYKAYVADSLDGQWKPLAASRDQPFASPANVTAPSSGSWTDSYSHGELIRSGINQRLEVEGGRLQFLFQGASAAEYHVGDYGLIAWKLGILELKVD